MTIDSLHVNASGFSHMSSHNGELKIQSVYGKWRAHWQWTTMTTSSPRQKWRPGTRCLWTTAWGGWPYVLCRKVFPNDAKMIVNMRHHTDEKPYGCDQCKMRFKLKGTLKRHKSTHSERKP